MFFFNRNIILTISCYRYWILMYAEAEFYYSCATIYPPNRIKFVFLSHIHMVASWRVCVYIHTRICVHVRAHITLPYPRHKCVLVFLKLVISACLYHVALYHVSCQLLIICPLLSLSDLWFNTRTSLQFHFFHFLITTPCTLNSPFLEFHILCNFILIAAISKFYQWTYLLTSFGTIYNPNLSITTLQGSKQYNGDVKIWSKSIETNNYFH